MKQNTLFNYLKKTIASDTKPQQNFSPSPSKNSNPTFSKPQSFSKLKSQEDQDLQKALNESLKLSQASQPLKRLKKGHEVDSSEPIKLPPKQSSKSKKQAAFLANDQPLTEEQAQIEIEKVIGDLSKQELDFNLERFKFTKGNSQSDNKNTIESLFKQRKEKEPKDSGVKIIKEIQKLPVNKYLTLEEEKDDVTEILTEEFASEPDDDFFEKLNKRNKNIKSQEKPQKPIIQSNKKPAATSIKNNLVWTKEKSPMPHSKVSSGNKLSDMKADQDNPPPVKKKVYFPKKSSPNKTPVNLNGPLFKLSFVFTGLLDCGDRDTITDIVKSEGGKVVGNVSSKTDYLIVGSKLEDGRPPDSSSKYRKAVEHKTKILTEGQFEEFFFNKTKKRITDILDQLLHKSLASAIVEEKTEPEEKNTILGKDLPKKVGFNQYFNTKKEEENQEIKGDQKESLIQKGRSDEKPINSSKIQYENTPELQTPSKKSPISKKDKVLMKSTTLWTKKHAPKDITDLIGNGENIRKLIEWLSEWDNVLKGEKRSQKSSNWSTASNPNARACLLSGPPGIGKTTCVRALAKFLKFELVEKNASDMRNKSSINILLGDLKSNSLIGADKKIKRKIVILMDEVDGMSGSDRGGAAALIEIIKTTKIPIICICNDRQNPKIRSLAFHCYDLRFQRPAKQTIAKRIGEICQLEGFAVDFNTLELLCESLNNDIRQIMNVLEMMKRNSKDMRFFEVKSRIPTIKKDSVVMLSSFDAAGKLMNRFENRKLEMREKLDLFFIDYDLIPLLFQENYLSACTKDIDLEILAKTSELIAFGDCISNAIRRKNEWGLMPNLGIISTIYPALLSSNTIPFPKFPEFLGKNSSQRKITREIKELKVAMGPVITGDRMAVKFDYSAGVLGLILHNLLGEEGKVELALHAMEHYQITPELLKEHLVDVQFNPKKLDLLHTIPTQTKTSLTRLYNKLHKDTFRGKKTGVKKSEMEIEQVKDPFYEDIEGKGEEEEEEEGREDEGVGEESEEFGKDKKKTEKKTKKKAENKKIEKKAGKKK